MTLEREERLSQLKRLNRYFGGHTTYNPGFTPEFEASRKIIAIIEQEKLSYADCREVAKIFNEVLAKEHYDGSGWLDFKIQLFGFIHFCGFDPLFDKEGNMAVGKNS